MHHKGTYISIAVYEDVKVVTNFHLMLTSDKWNQHGKKYKGPNLDSHPEPPIAERWNEGSFLLCTHQNRVSLHCHEVQLRGTHRAVRLDYGEELAHKSDWNSTRKVHFMVIISHLHQKNGKKLGQFTKCLYLCTHFLCTYMCT